MRASSRPLYRLAAAIAVVAGLGAIAALVLSQRGGGAPDKNEMAIVRPDSPAPSAPNAPAVEAVRSERALAAAHLESALDESFDASTATRPASAVIVALADRGGGSLAGFAAFEGAMSDELEPLLSTGTLLGGDDITYDGLSQELASVVMRAPSSR